MRYHLLNLSFGKQRLSAEPLLGEPVPVAAIDDFPEPSAEPLILYILGHAAPDELLEGDVARPDHSIATAIESWRGNASTLLIWDVCFAKSFLNIERDEPWNTNYVHVFACQRYERAWHHGGQQNHTIFSTALHNALEQFRNEPNHLSWDGLTLLLNANLGGLQTAEIEHWGGLTANDFLDQLLA
ncbi:MAG TPA: hypothetical protein VK540_34300 [Polyangiaceae bacterium]|nr:hypothetical protein [Polyangiaceae bacterium]